MDFGGLLGDKYPFPCVKANNEIQRVAKNDRDVLSVLR
jgi:hypothetical protein